MAEAHDAPRVESPEVLRRRAFLSRISIALGAAGTAILGIPIVAYLLSPLINPTPDTWVPVGGYQQFTIDQTVEATFNDPSPLQWAGQTASTAVWVRRTDDQIFIVFALNCTHLGCPVNWRPDADLFLCPCHGGVYYADGTVAGGPPPLPLPQYQWRVNGANLEILTRPLAFA